jgi:hypothetical protein
LDVQTGQFGLELQGTVGSRILSGAHRSALNLIRLLQEALKSNLGTLGSALLQFSNTGSELRIFQQQSAEARLGCMS